MYHRPTGLLTLFTAVTVVAIAVLTCSEIGCRKRVAASETTEQTMVAAEHHICTYLSRDEVQEILGTPVEEPVEEGTRCTYNPAEGGLGGAVIDVNWHGGDLAMRRAMARKTALGFTAQAVPGVGDEAMFGIPSTLYARKGDIFFTVEVHPSDDPRGKATAIAQKLLTRF